MLPDGGRPIVAHIAHRDTTRPGGAQVDIVDAGGGHADEPQIHRLGDRGTIERDLVGDHHLAAGQAAGKLGDRGRRMPIPIGQGRRQPGEVEILGMQAVAVEHHPAHDGSTPGIMRP